MQPTLVAAAILAALGAHHPATANPYDDCILQNMGGAQNKDAVYAIERSCISKSSTPIPENEAESSGSDAVAYPGVFNIGRLSPEKGLEIHFTNRTKFNITKLNVLVQQKKTNQLKTHVVTEFLKPLPNGMFVSSLGEPSLINIIPSGSEAQFFVPVEEVSPEFFKQYDWEIVPTRGILAD